jgi:hypothetical protein
MGSNWSRVIITVFLAMSLLTPGAVFAGADDLVKQADKIIRNAERKMHSGKNEEAATMLQEATALLEKGKSEDPTNTKISQSEQKLARIQKSVDKKLGKTAAKTSSSEAKLPKKPQPKSMSSRSSTPATTTKTIDSTELPSNVKSNLTKITMHLDQVESILAGTREMKKDGKTYGQDKRGKQSKRQIEEAAEIFELIDKRYTGKFDPNHPDFVVVKNRYNKLAGKAEAQGNADAKAKADAASAKAGAEKKSAEWTVKFREYLSYPGNEGHNPDKLVFVPGTSEPEKFADAQKRYEAFKKFYEEYKQTDFPAGKTWQLEDLADNQAPLRLKNFEEQFADRMGSVAQRAESEISSAMAQLEKDNGWKSDKSIKPNLVDHKWMTSIGEATDQAVTALGDAPEAKKLQAKFDALKAKDNENRQIRKERTFMTPDVYTGNDIKALKKKAEFLVKSNIKEGGKPLRTTVIAEDWREETVHEWTDTSRTERHWRTTRHQTAQVAAKTPDGVRLITVALAQNKQSDSEWGPLYGNLHQYSDPMLESNVNKNGP